MSIINFIVAAVYAVGIGAMFAALPKVLKYIPLDYDVLEDED